MNLLNGTRRQKESTEYGVEIEYSTIAFFADDKYPR